MLATTPSGPQAAVGGIASASSDDGTNVAANAFDGVMSSVNFWRSASNSMPSGTGRQHIQYTFGAGNEIDVAEVRIYFNDASFSTAYPSNFALLYSDDGAEWVVQRAWGDMVFAIGETRTLDATPLPSNQLSNRVVIRRDYRYNAAANTGIPPSVVRVLPHPIMGFGVHHGSAPSILTPWSGGYFIAGSTTSLGLPLARRVDLIDQRSGALVRQFFTKADGQFLFEWIGPGPWTLVGVDSSAEQNSVVFAHILPALMT